MSKERLSLLFTSVLVGGALVVIGLVIKKQVTSSPDALTNIRYVQEWELLAADGHEIGAEDAPVKIVEFFDYQCPYCKKVKPVLEEIRRRYPEKVTLVARHLPVTNRPQAVTAALASEFAAEQGRFAAYHDLLFINQDELGQVSWSALAQKSGIPDIATFQECTNTAAMSARIERDVKVAKALRINSVPALIVNGQLVSGAVSVKVLDRLVQNALAEQKG